MLSVKGNLNGIIEANISFHLWKLLIVLSDMVFDFDWITTNIIKQY